jgi:hypothetical protein
MTVRGAVSVGDQPLEGRVRLREKSTEGQIELETDAEGRFSGYFPSVLPESARWMADVQSLAPPIRQRLDAVEPTQATPATVEFDLVLPGGELEGVVVDEAGAPRLAEVIVLPSTDEAREEGSRAAFTNAGPTPKRGASA